MELRNLREEEKNLLTTFLIFRIKLINLYENYMPMGRAKRPVKCGRCKGTGVIDDLMGATCHVCKGVGKVRI